MTVPNRMTIFWKNLVTSSMISCNDENTTFPATNLVDGIVSNVARTNDNSGNKIWTIDLGGSSISYDTFAIAGHNLPASTGTYKLDRSTGTGDPTSLITLTDTHYIYYWDTPGTQRYIKFSALENVSIGYHELGEIWLGMRYEAAFNPQIPMRIIRDKNETILSTAGGQTWSYLNYDQRGYELKFDDNMTPAQYASLEEIHDDRRLSKAFFFNLAPQDSNDSVYFGYTKSFNFSIDGKDMRPGTWIILEEK